MTKSERLLWAVLRDRAPGWLTEVPTGRYRLDFFSPEAAFAVGVDGGSHVGQDRARYDERRDLWHAERGIETFRVSASEVERDLPSVLRMIDSRLNHRLLSLGKPPVAPHRTTAAVRTAPPVRRAPRAGAMRTNGARPPARAVRGGSAARRRLLRALWSILPTIVLAGLFVIYLCDVGGARTTFGHWVSQQVVNAFTPKASPSPAATRH